MNNVDMFTRPSFGHATLANMTEMKNGIEYLDDPNHEYDVFISSDDKQIKIQRVPAGECIILNMNDYRAVPVKERMIMFFGINVTEYKKEKVFGSSIGITFKTQESATNFLKAMKMAITMQNKAPVSTISNGKSEFNSRTEENSASQYFQFYSWLSQQQNMMQDFVRTTTYQKAMLGNPSDFRDKVVLDVGAGSGVLSFFAIQAGAKKVYAVEASQMAVHCTELVRTNGLSSRIIVIPGKIEEVEIPEQVDVIVSEPMGYMLVNERMLESYMYGRKFLKPGGRMFPTTGDLYFALFNDDALFLEYNQKHSFWTSTNFLGVNLSALKGAAYQELFKQPIVDTWHPSILISDFGKWSVDFEKDPVEKLHVIEFEQELTVKRASFCHGVATWFDVSFLGTNMQSYLSTAPNAPLTHWYQVRCPIMNPILVQVGDKVHVKLRMVANEKQSYDMMLVISLNGVSQTAEYDLKNPSFRYTGAAVQPAAGLSNESATQQLSQMYQVDQDGNVLAYGSDPNYVYVDGLDVQMQDTNGYQQGNYPSAPVIMNGQPFTPAAVGTPQSVASPFTGSH
uniref:Type I protein arginine methyltransferase n=1 Tax=Panagrolaimus sp. JU765 TaxID=591449 RepID=A0AC34QNZ5_9BILA